MRGGRPSDASVAYFLSWARLHAYPGGYWKIVESFMSISALESLEQSASETALAPDAGNVTQSIGVLGCPHTPGQHTRLEVVLQHKEPCSGAICFLFLE